MPLRARLALATLLVGGAVAWAPAVAAAQTTAPRDTADTPVVPELRRVEGRVVLPAGGEVAPAAGHWVTIHRVGPDSAGPMDSVRTDAAGRYAFRYRTWGSDRAIYFVSVSYSGIAYFSQPLMSPAVSGDEAEIMVFDTTSARIPLSVRGRHLIVLDPPPAGGDRREVIEVYELSNDTTVTSIAPARDGGAATPVWTAVVPAGAREFRVGQGDVAPDAVRLAGERVELFAPLAPGLKQISFSYTVPASSFPLRVPLERQTSVFEVLVEGARGSASGARLREVNPVVQDGRNFRRFLAQDAPAAAVASVSFPPLATAGSRSLYVALVATGAGALMLVALAAASARRRRPAGIEAAAAVGEPSAVSEADRLARAIATLDASFERQRSPSEEARAAYQTRRASLKRDLAAALAGGGRQP